MKLIQLVFIGTVCMLAGISGIHQHLRVLTLERDVLITNNRTQTRSEQLFNLHRDNSNAIVALNALKIESQSLVDHQQELMSLRDQVARIRQADYSNLAKNNGMGLRQETATKSWEEKTARLQRRLAETPELQIPEIELVTEQDWLDVSKNELLTEEDYQWALGKIRQIGEHRAASALANALTVFMKEGGKPFPTNMNQLRIYLDTPLSQRILDRWDVYPSGILPIPMVGKFLITQKYPGKTQYTTRFYFNEKGRLSTQGTANPPERIEVRMWN